MLKHLETVSNDFLGGELLRTKIEVTRRQIPENSQENLSPGRNASKRPFSTLRKTNIVPENQRLEDEISCNDGLS